jgi:hypothetical protein
MANITTLNTTVIDPGDLAYVPWEIWVVLFALVFIFFFHSIIFKRNSEITAIISAVLAAVTAYLSGYISFSSVEVVTFATGNSTVQPVSYIAHPTWLAYLMLLMFLVGIVNTWRCVHENYFNKEGVEGKDYGRSRNRR